MSSMKREWSANLRGILAALVVSMAFAAPTTVAAQAPGSVNAGLRALVDGNHRAASNTERDRFRRPFEVLQFLEIKPDSTVIEISPGAAGYWTEMLAPYLKEHGLYIAANPAPTSPAAKAGVEKFNADFRGEAGLRSVALRQGQGDRLRARDPGFRAARQRRLRADLPQPAQLDGPRRRREGDRVVPSRAEEGRHPRHQGPSRPRTISRRIRGRRRDTCARTTRSR